ncbi:hypothetical protein HAX54_017424 [Datura stramonium]|uniref:C3HC-type domain-containing protein n=1 Tax=Datura stramonium TaxID=4076 RepID=A0ABS8ULF2_DATST|nr:hypothetical protein [Datura stramonium]
MQFCRASSPAVPTNAGGTDWFAQAQGSKAASLSRIGSQPMWTSVSNSAGGSGFQDHHNSCRPWERGDLLRRLSTFQPTNWFANLSSHFGTRDYRLSMSNLPCFKASSSLACARRGWVNVDVDTIECEACGANLKFVSSTIWTPEEADIAGEEFAKKLEEGHKATCPWRGNSCAESLVQFPPTPPSALIGGYKDHAVMDYFSFLHFQLWLHLQLSIRISRSSEIDRLLACCFCKGTHLLG